MLLSVLFISDSLLLKDQFHIKDKSDRVRVKKYREQSIKTKKPFYLESTAKICKNPPLANERLVDLNHLPGYLDVPQLKRITSFLDKQLLIPDYQDSSNNGLQVENRSEIIHVCCGVDASMEFFQAARAADANLLICHHGLSWGDSLKRITGLNYERLAYLINNDIALYACHLPLDAHPKLGNNAQICKALGLVELKPFGVYNGKEIGFEGRLPKPMDYAQFKKRVGKAISPDLRCMDFGKQRVTRIAVVSGGAAQEIAEAGEKRVDVYLSGEPALSAYGLAQEYKINAIFAGHYATEVFGVRAIAELLKRKFRVKVSFLDFGVPY